MTGLLFESLILVRFTYTNKGHLPTFYFMGKFPPPPPFEKKLFKIARVFYTETHPLKNSGNGTDLNYRLVYNQRGA